MASGGAMAARRWELLLVAATAVICVVLAAHAIAAIVSGWVPQGDEGIIAVKVHDVLSSHPPLQGQRSTSVLTTQGVWAHHPGPSEFYLLAIPYAITGFSPAGLLVGCLLVQVACVLLAVRAAYRTGGLIGGWVVAGVLALLVAGFGAALVRPWNLYFSVLGLVTVLVLAWRLAVGHTDALVAYVAVASLCVQPHVTLVSPVLAVSLLVAVIGLWQWRIRHAAMWPLSGVHPHDRPPWWRRRGTIAIAVGALCWAPVLVESVTFRPNNLIEMLHVMLGGGATAYGSAAAPARAGAVGLGSAISHVGGMILPFGPAALHTVLLVALLIAAAVAVGQAIRSARVDGTLARAVVPTGVLVTTSSLLSVVWVGSRAQSSFQLLYLVVLTGAVYLFAAMVLWWCCRQLRHGRRVAAAALALAAVGALVGYPRAVDARARADYAAWVAVARSTDQRVVAALGRPEFADRPVVIRYSGGYSWTSLSPAVAAALAGRGREVYFDVIWPRAQDDDFRRVSKAPEDAVTVWIRDAGPGQDWPKGSLPEGGCEMHDVDLAPATGPGHRAQVCVTG